MKLSRLSAISLLMFVATISAGCGMINQIRSKNALNEGARAFKDARFGEAQQKFEYAYQLDPSQKRLPVLIARTILQQYKPGVTTPENLEKANQALKAYQDILVEDPDNEEAFKAIVFLYRNMKNETEENKWLMQRATLQTAPPDTRAAAYIVLTSKQWQCSYDITEQHKATENKGGAVILRYKKPDNQEDFGKARQCAEEGLRLAQQAIDLDKENPNAWSYKANLMREMSKLAEMEGNAQAKADYDRQYQEALEVHTRLNQEAEKRKEAEEAAKSPSPAS